MARIIGGVATSHTPTIGFAFDRNKQDDPVWKPIFEAYEPIKAWLQGEAAGRAVHDLQRPRHLVLLRPLLGLRAGHRRGVRRSPTKAAARAGAAADQGPRRARAPHRQARWWPTSSTCRSSRTRALDHGCFSPLSVLLAHDARVADPDRPAAGRRAAVPDARAPRAATSSARRCARAIESYPGGPQGRRGGAPAACRTRCTASAAASTTRRGTSSSWSCSRTTRRRSPA